MGTATWRGPFTPGELLAPGIQATVNAGQTISPSDQVCLGLRESDPSWWIITLAEGNYPSTGLYPSTTLYPN